MSRRAMPETIDLDAILVDLGSIGRYQIGVFAYLMFTVISTAINSNQYVFSAGPVKYRCKVPTCEAKPEKYEMGSWAQFALPENEKDRMCLRYVSTGKTCVASSFTNRTEICDSWVYEDDNSISTEFNLACQEWKRAMIGTIRNFAYFCTMPFVTIFSDMYGRRKVLIFTAITPALAGIARSFSTNYYEYICMEFLEAFLGSGSFSTMFILALEMVKIEYRVLGGSIISSTQSSGLSLLGVVAWIVPYWRTRTRILYAPALIFIIYFWIAQESIRWLIAKGRLQEAAIVILKVAKVNNTKLPVKTLTNLNYFASGKHNMRPTARRLSRKQSEQTNISQKRIPMYKQVCGSRVILLRIVVCSLCWITSTMVYYGITINSVSLRGNRYFNFILTSLIEMPGFLASVVTLDRFGRKISIMSAYLICGISLLSIATVTNSTTMMALSMLGKMCISMVFCSVYIYTIELFPTQSRHMLMGVCSMVGRCGSMAAPQTQLLMFYMKSLPYVVFGTMACCAALLLMFTPETLKMKLPNTIEEAENMGVMPHTAKITTDIRKSIATT